MLTAFPSLLKMSVLDILLRAFQSGKTGIRSGKNVSRFMY